MRAPLFEQLQEWLRARERSQKGTQDVLADKEALDAMEFVSETAPSASADQAQRDMSE